MKKTSPDGDYFLRYYLHSDPFPTAERDPLLFVTPELERRLQRIVTLLEETDQLVVVTGASGAGKSTVAARLADLLDENRLVASVRAHRHWEVETLAGALIEPLVPKEIAGLAPVTRVYKFLEHCDRNRITPLVIVDDAHRLEDRPLEFLLQIAGQSYNRTRLRFVLLGGDGLPERIEDAKVLASDSVGIVHLPAFSGEQTADYIGHRLAACGLEGESPLDPVEVARIHRISGGLPGGIHHLARQALIAAGADTGRSRSRGWAALALVLVAVAGAYAYINDYLPWGPSAPAPVPVAVTPPEAAPAVEEPPAAPMPAPIAEPPEFEEAPVADEIPEEFSGTAIAAVTGEDLPSPSSIPADAPATPAPEPEPVYEEPVPAETALPHDAVIVETIGASPETAATDPEDTFVPQSIDPAWRAGLRGPDWIRQQPEGTHFLQLINASDAGNAARMLRRLDPVRADLAAYTNYTPSGRPRYLILYGAYPDRAAAEAAIADLPALVRTIPPWPRARAGILTDMEKAEARDLAP